MARKPIVFLLLNLLSLPSAADPLSVRLTGTDGLGVEGVIVYLEGGSAAAGAASMPLEIRQQDKRFSPYIGVMARGGQVLFSNHDDITHHIYSFNGPARFSFLLQPGAANTEQQFPESGVIAMGCNIHDWMSGYLLVLDNPWFATTQAEGRAVIEGVPPGRYRLVAWHPQLQENEPPAVIVEVPGAAEVALRLTAPMAEIPRQEDLDDFDFLEAY